MTGAPEKRAWLMLAAGEDRQHGGNDGYDDAPDRHYSWDSTVANFSLPQPGDVIALWDKQTLLGLSVIDHIERANGRKVRKRCPSCQNTGFKERRDLMPRFRCNQCRNEFDAPLAEPLDVTTYRSNHSAAWVELPGMLDAAALRALCIQPKSQHSIRELDWARFRGRVQDSSGTAELRVINEAQGNLPGGHRQGVVRVRIGQRRFRQLLLNRFGSTCALTGANPPSTLDAAHLYEYAAHGRHEEHGGFLLRKDIHRLFDLGLLCIRPDNLEIDVDEELIKFPVYASLHGQRLCVAVAPKTRSWLEQHWKTHRFAR